MLCVCILSHNTGLSVSWQQEEYMFSESNDPQMVCAEIVAGSLEIGVSVVVQAENGTALAGMYGYHSSYLLYTGSF